VKYIVIEIIFGKRDPIISFSSMKDRNVGETASVKMLSKISSRVRISCYLDSQEEYPPCWWCQEASQISIDK
jgi:hypothetical protein